jgi:hypothetical protein
MTVQELINELNQVENKELRVLFQTTDPTDWTYVFEVEEENISLEDETYDSGCGEFGSGLVITIDF